MIDTLIIAVGSLGFGFIVCLACIVKLKYNMEELKDSNKILFEIIKTRLDFRDEYQTREQVKIVNELARISQEVYELREPLR